MKILATHEDFEVEAITAPYPLYSTLSYSIMSQNGLIDASFTEGALLPKSPDAFSILTLQQLYYHRS